MKVVLDALGKHIRNKRAYKKFRPATFTLEFQPDDSSNDPNSVDYLITIQADHDDIERTPDGSVCIRTWVALSELLQLISGISMELANCQYDLQQMRKTGP